MRVLLLGASGQLGQAFAKELKDLSGVELYRHSGRHLFDLCDLTKTGEMLNQVKPHLVINCAAFNDVDEAEENPLRAHAMNASLPTFLGICARDHEFGLIHFSTDAVFDGSDPAFPFYSEDHTPNPVNVYGESKLLGEQGLLLAEDCPVVIFRTSWLWSLTGECFVTKILRKTRVAAVKDVIGVPTFAGDLAKEVVRILKDSDDGPLYWASGADDWATSHRGIYHLCSGGGAVSKHGFARIVFRWAGRSFTEVKPILSSQWVSQVPRPRDVRLNCEKSAKVFEAGLPDWEDSLRRELSYAAKERPPVLDGP